MQTSVIERKQGSGRINMEYKVRQIEDKKEINQCDTFYIDQYNWGGSYRPKTYGKMGFVKKEAQEGFLIWMTCEESDPVRTYHKANDPVYLDSAMEAFLCFGTTESNGIQKPYYMNFEMNANGAMLASIGCERMNRINLSEDIRMLIHCTPKIKEDTWELTLWIPVTVIYSLYGIKDMHSHLSSILDIGSTFTCNFFKLMESKGETQHFASFSPIKYPEPNFHLPEYFAYAVIV